MLSGQFIRTTPSGAAKAQAAAKALKDNAARLIERLWAEAETSARQKQLAGRPNWGERPLNPNERTAITVLIDYQAAITGISAYEIEREVLSLFGAEFNVETLGGIKAWNFDEVIRYLTDFEKISREPLPHDSENISRR
jgi:hypothetical protein